MTKSELIQKLSEQCDIPHSRAKLAVDNMFEIMTRNLISGEKLEIRGFGTFGMKVAKAHVGRNPKNGETIHVGEKRSLCFKTSSVLNQRLNESVE